VPGEVVRVPNLDIFDCDVRSNDTVDQRHQYILAIFAAEELPEHDIELWTKFFHIIGDILRVERDLRDL
jgi:hypothetical protein